MSRRCRAFTLVELLVVAAIMAVLFGLIVTAANPGSGSQVRQAAQSIASVLLATQSRAIGKPAGAGVILEPPSGGGSAVTAVATADMLPLITGSCTAGMPPTILASSTAAVTIAPNNADAADLTDGYKIRFHEEQPAVQGPTAWMEFKANAVTFRAGTQTKDNTIWPKPVNGGPFMVAIARYPQKGQTLYALPKAAAIDLRYSGFGDGATFSAKWSNLSGKGAVAIGFDSVGEVDAVMQQVLSLPAARTEQPIAPTQPIYLLVATRSEVEAGANTLASSTSLWVTIHPQTGRVSVASNVPQSGSDATALRAARAKARAGVSFGK